ncbi:Poly(3-hydroxyalkanoate) synthetase [Marinospirillum celere]|uniref:Poly(3-hydroxyalkanoate) synthetase n=1 Tax=Marinospirillum celere TaxID=1122252 RepID=A0A1I1IBS4_9GAMM|nr:alpha/beta hydrolase [Marinospirillum celere]SFC33471.1 Poly(3-hydroxyalkanoate) synthetase [Marinospirillum celere]
MLDAKESQALPRLTADFLDSFMGVTPADNPARYKDTRHWLSEFNGLCLKNLFAASQLQENLWSPYGVPRELFTGWLRPLVKASQEAASQGRDPDLVAQDNLRIEAAYASKLRSLLIALTSEIDASDEEKLAKSDYLTRQGKKLIFDRDQCNWACQTPAGQTWLLGQLLSLQTLEWQYHSYGQTRLRAMKKLLRSLLQVIANEPLSELKRNPYRKPSPEGTPRQSDEDYLLDCELRLLALLAHDAIDIRRFALESPHARLGACKWETVPGSEIYSVRLRHYLRPAGVKPNGKTLYMASPMINRCEIFDLAPEKSVVEGMLQLGYDVYMVDYGNPGPDQSQLGLSFYGKTVHDNYLNLITERHPEQHIEVMAYCMGGTLFMPYLARRIEEAEHGGKDIKIRQVVLMTTPIFFDDETSGHQPMRNLIRESYDFSIMQTFFGNSNLPPQTIEAGMHAIQPGVTFSVAEGFYARANFHGALDDAAPFLHWLNSGTRFPVKAHREWIERIFINNEIWEGEYTLPSSIKALDAKPVDMDALNRADIAIFDYRGQRDPIAPVGSCKTSERWGRKDNVQMTRGGLNRTIEKNIGHIFVVSKKLLGEYLETVADFLADEPPAYQPGKRTESSAKPAASPAAKKTSRKPATGRPATKAGSTRGAASKKTGPSS